MYEKLGMTRAMLGAVIALACCTARATEQLPVTVVSPCECRYAHGKGRWAVKNDPSTPPADVSTIQAFTPSDALRCISFRWGSIPFSKQDESLSRSPRLSGGILQ